MSEWASEASHASKAPVARTTITTTAKTIVKKGLCVLNRQLNRYQDKLFILGEGRSGTTWLMNLLNFDDRYRMLFEPFQTENFAAQLPYESEYPFPDRTGESNVAHHISRVLRGEYISKHATVRFQRAIFDGLLIKDVCAHLIIDQIIDAAPDMGRVLILRHPFAVASSKSGAFSWPTKPSAFLSIHNPRRGELESQRELIENVEQQDHGLLTQIMLWCMTFRFAFAARHIASFVPVFYEQLVAEPETELERVFSELGMMSRFEANRAAIVAKLDRLSHVTQNENTIASSKRGHAQWLDRWPGDTIDRGLGIISAFGMDFLYRENYSPLCTVGQLKTYLADDKPAGASRPLPAA